MVKKANPDGACCHQGLRKTEALLFSRPVSVRGENHQHESQNGKRDTRTRLVQVIHVVASRFQAGSAAEREAGSNGADQSEDRVDCSFEAHFEHSPCCCYGKRRASEGSSDAASGAPHLRRGGQKT